MKKRQKKLLMNDIKTEKIKVPWFKNKRIVAGVVLGFFLLGIFISLINSIVVMFS